MEQHAKIILKNSRLTAYITGFIAFIVFTFVLITLKDILVPLTVAIFLTFLFHPLVKLLSKYKIPHWVTIFFILSILVIINYYFILVIISNLTPLQDKLQVYSVNLVGFIQEALKPFRVTLRDFAGLFQVSSETGINSDNLFDNIKSGAFINILNSLPSIVLDFFITMIFWVLMIIGKDQFDERLELAFSKNGKKIVASINQQLQSYMILKTIISIITAVIVTIILLIYKIEFAIIWGLLTFLLNYIPNIGSTLATIAPLLISALEYGFGFRTVSLAILLVVTQTIIGNLLEPHYLGKQMDLSPVFVLFSLFFWGLLWGIPGMFLAVPIAAAIKILFNSITPLKPFAFIMGAKNT